MIRRLFRRGSKAPLGLAGLLSITLFFAGLMASSLAVDKPRVVQRLRHGKLVLHYEQSSNATEAKIWLLALVPVGILLAVAVLAMLWRRGGLYVVSAAAIAMSLLLPRHLDAWTARHTRRFPIGVDLISDSSSSNLASRGEWEQNARDTVISLAHWTIGIAIAAAVIVVGLALLRRVSPRQAFIAAPPPVVTGEPEASPVLGAVEGESRLVRRGLAGRLFGGGR
ncbi:MAG: hypothetical protein E6G22_11055 [Actinobacteria bacterium]|nr:MAG: hypothetical protein E6G22_11055 [Actinomycetota bacterium]